MFKKWWKHISIGALVAGFITLTDIGNGISSLWNIYILGKHQDEVQLFEDTSAIIDHRFTEDGFLQLKYRTCNPPVETPYYWYIIWVDGAPTIVYWGDTAFGPRLPNEGHQSIGTFWKESHCSEGWWGTGKIANAKQGSEIKVAWHWLLDDGSYQTSIMEYTVK